MGTNRRSKDHLTQRDRDMAVRDEPTDAQNNASDIGGFDLAVEDEAFWAALACGRFQDLAEPESTDFWPEEDSTNEGEASR